MLSDARIRPYAPEDETDVLAVWNEAMWADPINANAWRSRYLLDPNFSAYECLVAVDSQNEEILGFALGFTDKRSIHTGPNTLIDAWVVGFGVREHRRREGTGIGLLRALEQQWLDAGVHQIHFGPYLPAYVAPGVDVEAYADAVKLLTAFGAKESSRALSMKASLTVYRPHQNVVQLKEELSRNDITVQPVTPRDILPLLGFLTEHFPDWRRDATLVLRDSFSGDPLTGVVYVAKNGDEIIGYAQARAERFGPFGVDEAYRGRGVGAILLSDTLKAIRANGFHCAWFLWTTDRAAKLYKEHGFEEVRRFTIMTKTLEPEARQETNL